jgi:uncharacterized protein (TIRG00374 family)
VSGLAVSKKLKSLLILAVGAGLVYWFARRLDWQEVGTHLRAARIWPLLVAACLINLTLLVRAFRWQAFLAPITHVSLRNAFAATSVGFGSVFVIGRAGEVVRPMVLTLRERLRLSATIATVMIERIYDMSAVIGLFAINLLFFKMPSGKADDLRTFNSIRSTGLILSLAVAGGIVLLIILRLRAEIIINFLERKSSRLPRKLVRPLLNLINHLSEGLSVLLDGRELVTTILYTLMIWGLVTGETWLVLMAFGLDFPLSYVIFVLGFGLVGSVVPTPGGSAGAFHAAAAAALTFLGLERNFAASVAIIFHLISFGPPFLIGLFYLVRDGIGLGQLREMIAHEGGESVAAQDHARSTT